MSKQTIDYSGTIIYKIICNDTSITDIYIGHTTNLITRKRNHKSHCTNIKSKKYNFKLYQFIRENGDFSNWNMLPIEIFPCENKKEAEIRECYWIKTLGATLNDIMPTQTYEEWKAINKTKIIQYKHDYYIKNKEAIDKKNTLNYEANKEARAISMKTYYEDNKDVIIKRSKDYYEAHKLEIETYTCECGSIVRTDGKNRHLKSLKHLDYLASL